MAFFQVEPASAYETWRIVLTIAGSVVTFASVSLAAFVLYRSRTAAYWKDERDVAVVKAERVTAENVELKKENARLLAATDLSHFKTENQQEHEAIVAALRDISSKGQERYEKVLEAMTENTRAVLGFQSQMAGVFDKYQMQAGEMIQLLRTINDNTRRGGGA